MDVQNAREWAAWNNGTDFVDEKKLTGSISPPISG